MEDDQGRGDRGEDEAAPGSSDPRERLRLLPELVVDRARLRLHHVAAVVHYVIDRSIGPMNRDRPAGCARQDPIQLRQGRLYILRGPGAMSTMGPLRINIDICVPTFNCKK